MGGSGGASGLASIMDKLPSFRKVMGWFKGNDMNIDNHLFRMHYLVSTNRFGELFENHEIRVLGAARWRSSNKIEDLLHFFKIWILLHNIPL